METRVGLRAKVSSRKKTVSSAQLLASTFHLLDLLCFSGVLKAIGHINDTLGPALIESVSTDPLWIRQTDDLEKTVSYDKN